MSKAGESLLQGDCEEFDSPNFHHALLVSMAKTSAFQAEVTGSSPV